MARPNAQQLDGDSKRGNRSARVSQDTDQASVVQAPRKGWPFAEGSQNHLDDANAPWPRPSRSPVARTASVRDSEKASGGNAEPAQ